MVARASIKKVSRSFKIKNFGCRATQSDGAAIAADLAGRGLLRMEDASKADIVVVNTCTVTAEADRDARQAINRIHREHPDTEILVTGCYAQSKPAELAALNGVKWVVGNSHKHEIGEILAPNIIQIKNIPPVSFSYHSQIGAAEIFVGQIDEQKTLPLMPTGDPLGRNRPNVKVQDGCNNRCSFCIIPSVRGQSRSATTETVIQQVRRLEQNYPEIVLTGINLGRWGRDLDGRPQLVDLIKTLLDETVIQKIRLSSVEPMDWSEQLLNLMAATSRIAKHVHIPLQSGSDALLRRMRRRYRVRHYRSRIELARKLMPDAAIGADVMVGFPGEEEEHFEQTRDFIKNMPFSYLHVFPYSMREGTQATDFEDQVPRKVKKQRSRLLRELIDQKNEIFRKGLLGNSYSAVVINSDTQGARVLSDNFLDIELPGVQARRDHLVKVLVEQIDGSRTVGSLVH